MTARAPLVAGERFGRLVLIGGAPDEGRRYLCACDCGTEKRIHYTSLRSGRTISCGCLRRIKVWAPLKYPEKTCAMCGCAWSPATKAQAARNITCGPECRGALISQRKREAVADVQSRLAEKSVADGDCRIWTGGLADGYGRISIDGKHQAAHRVAYELAHGSIPEGLELDHLCRRRACINPAHMEPVTHLENVRRGAKVHPELGRSV